MLELGGDLPCNRRSSLERSGVVKIAVEIDKCIGAGQCARVAPRTFAQGDDDGLVILLQEAPGIEEAPLVVEASRLCPTQAIVIVEAVVPLDNE